MSNGASANNSDEGRATGALTASGKLLEIFAVPDPALLFAFVMFASALHSLCHCHIFDETQCTEQCMESWSQLLAQSSTAHKDSEINKASVHTFASVYWIIEPLKHLDQLKVWS
jgi:hypothetical protein